MKNFNVFILLLTFALTPIAGYSQYQMVDAFPALHSFSYPVELVNSEDGTNRFFLVQQRGLIYVFNNNPTVNVSKTFLNLSSRVSQSGNELGLLGMAFHPDYENNGYFYIYHTFDSIINSSTTYWSRLSRYTVSPSNPDSALLSSQYIMLTLRQPYSNHNGGKITFGSDNYLYIGLGDGGSGGDPQGNGQNRSTLLGKILRIDIDSAGGGREYSIPVTNPFYNNSSGYKEEIYAYGIRNPWKFSFDPVTDRLFLGDVGQNLYEEIDVVENGRNYGWNKMEGFHCYGTCDTTGKGFIRPILEYSHSEGASVTGGYVYRGSLLPDLYGKYVYADYSYGKVWCLTYDGINPVVNTLLEDANFAVSSFGVDENNELYIVKHHASSGRIMKFINQNVATLELKLSIEGFYENTNDKLRITDTVTVFARQTTAPFAVADSATSVIDSLTFSGIFIFNNANTGTYYFQTRHRNALETWSSAGGSSLIKGGQVTYDFTNSASKAYGSNQVLINTRYNLFSGDIVKDGFVSLDDVLGAYNDAAIFETGYVPTDVSGNNIVDLVDILYVYNNSSNFVQSIAP
ncbi:MAG TPA: PQQ-dependent sugar dehydrogenase [Ignavibacteria bacterium]|nr:PQQ-dependent sugar dehydrogenase [Ignavibacteria bacterium]